MKSLAISCNEELLTLLRISGFEGKLCNKEEELKSALDEGLRDPEIGIILLDEEGFELLKDFVYRVKSKPRSPLIVTIPGRGGFREKDFILKYVKEAMGLKMGVME